MRDGDACLNVTLGLMQPVPGAGNHAHASNLVTDDPITRRSNV
jgi:hypothetical protein